MAVTKRAPVAAPRTAPRQSQPASVPQRTTEVPQGGGNFMSLNPEDFSQGGLLDDIDVTFKSCRFVEWDYQGKIDSPVLALLIEMEYEDGGKMAQADQYYSAGDLARFVPSEDGTHAISVGGGKGMADSTNAAELIKSVIGQGFPPDRFADGDVSAMDNLHAHINRVPQKKRGGGISEKNSAGYELTVAVVTKIHRMPWENEGDKRAGKGFQASPASRSGSAVAGRTPPPNKPSPSPATANGNTDVDLESAAAEILLGVLEAKNGTVAKTGIAPGSFKLLANNPNRAAILQLLTSNDWLEANGENFGWTFDGKQVASAQ